MTLTLDLNIKLRLEDMPKEVVVDGHLNEFLKIVISESLKYCGYKNEILSISNKSL